MAITGLSGPLIVYGQSPYAATEYNPDLGPSIFWGGAGILDPRLLYTYFPGESGSEADYGWLGFDNITTLSIVPYTKAVGAVVASANPTSGALTLVSANSATTGVYVTPSITRADTGAIDAGVNGAGILALDAYSSITASVSSGIMTVTANTSMPITNGMVLLSSTGSTTSGAISGAYVVSQLTGGTGGQGVSGTYQLSNSNLTVTSGTVALALQSPNNCVVPFGGPSSPSIAMWNPQAMACRALAVTAASGATYTTATISGYDVYGFPMVEAITLTAGSQVSGKKAFKYVRSVVLSGGTADTTHAYSVDTTDVFGLPLRSDTFADIAVNYATSLTAVTGITAATNYVVSDRTSPATATTGDVRGTYGAFTSGTGANKLVIRQSPQAQNIGSTVGLFGVAHYSNF
jgi:hypothetical protein